jgi:hypothetical protein
MFRNVVLPKSENVNVVEQNAERSIPGSGVFKTIEFGAGNKTFKGDERGIWMGSSDWDTAPWRVDMEGNIEIRATETTSSSSTKYYDPDGNLAILFGFRTV